MRYTKIIAELPGDFSRLPAAVRKGADLSNTTGNLPESVPPTTPPASATLQPDTKFGLVVLGIFVLATICLQLAARITNTEGVPPESPFVVVGLGYLLALIDLVSIYWVWGRLNIIWRTALLLLTLTVVQWVWLIITQIDLTDGVAAAVQMFFIATASALILCLGSIRLLGVRFTQVSPDLTLDLGAIPEGNRGQMSLKGLLSFVTSASLIMAWARFFPRNVAWREIFLSPEMHYAMFMLVTPIVALALVSVPTRWWIYAPIIFVWLIASIFVPRLFLNEIERALTDWQMFMFSFTHGGVIVATLILYRVAGYRMVWRIPPAPQPPLA